VRQYTEAAQRKVDHGQPTDAAQRLARLLSRYAGHLDPKDEDLGRMRYQLLSAIAGTESEAATVGAKHAILMVHEFLTDQRTQDKTAAHLADLTRFTTTVFGCGHPGPHGLPWCVEVPAPASMHARLYLTWAVTDLRRTTLEA
jgi:hypothetical protein